MTTELATVLFTGASIRIGATHAHGFARHGHSLVLVARGEIRVRAPASRLEQHQSFQQSPKTAFRSNQSEVRL